MADLDFVTWAPEPEAVASLTRFAGHARDQVRTSRGWRGQHWMWVARVLKRSDDKRKLILHRRTVSSEKLLLAPLQ